MQSFGSVPDHYFQENQPQQPLNPQMQREMRPAERHGFSSFFHVFFKAAAIATYLFAYFLSGNYVISFVLCIVFLSCDFWTVKNVTGRILVGLRWWNEIKEDGTSEWVFESLEDKSALLPSEQRLFWIALFVSPACWMVFAITSLLKFYFQWFLIVVVALCLQFANIVGYVKCAKDARKKISSLATNYIGKQMVNSYIAASVLEFTMNFPADAKELARIERKRRVEEERRGRIYDVKTRTMGLDTGAIDDQVKSKQDQRRLEREREMEIDRQRMEAYAQVDQMVAKREEERRLQAIEVSQYNSDILAREKKDREATVRASLPDLTATSLRGLQGEDVGQKERLKRQQEQQKEWVAQQLLEKQERLRKEKEMDRQYQQKIKEMEQRYVELESNHQRSKLEQLQQEKEDNKRLAEAKREKEIRDKLNETFNNLEEMKNQVTGSLLAENGNTARLDNPNRVVTASFKGMTSEKIKEIQDEQARQAREREIRKQMEREEQKKWEEMQATQARLLAQREAEIEQRRREYLKQIQEENRRKAEEQKEKLNKEYRTNQPGEDFFSQFNTTAR